MHLEVKGLDQLIKKLDELEKKPHNLVLSRALRAAARPLQSACKRHCPVRTGAWQSSMVIRSGKPKGSAVRIVVIAGDAKFANFYPKFVENGTRRKDGSWKIRPRNAMHAAWDETKDEQRSIFLDTAWKGIVEIAAK